MIATEYTHDPFTDQELISRNDLPIYNSKSDPSSGSFSPFGPGKNIIDAKLGVGGIKIEHWYLTTTEIINSLEVVKCFICQVYTHAVKSSESPNVFINGSLRRNPNLESNDTLCPLKVSLSHAVKPNSAFVGKKAYELQRLMFSSNLLKKQACAIDELITRTSKFKEEAQKQMEDEIRIFTEKAHEKYKAKQLAIDNSRDILAQLVASMDTVSDDPVAEKAQQNEEKATESAAMNSLGLQMEEQRKSFQQSQFVNAPSSTIYQGPPTNGNGYARSRLTEIVPDVDDLEFNVDDVQTPFENVNNESSNEEEEEDIENGSDGEIDDLQDDGSFHGNRQVSNDIIMPGRRGSMGGTNGSHGFNAYSRSVPIAVPFGRRNSRIIDTSNDSGKLEDIDEAGLDIRAKIVRDANNVIDDGYQKLPVPASRSLANRPI